MATRISCLLLLAFGWLYPLSGQNLGRVSPQYHHANQLQGAPNTLAQAAATTFQKVFSGAGNQSARYVLQTPNGGYLLAGTTTLADGTTDAFLMQLNAAGDVVWQKSYGGNSNEIFNIVQPANGGGFVAVGETESYGNGGRDVFVVKVNSLGVVGWTRTIGGAGFDAGRALTVLPDGYLISGAQNSVGAGSQTAFLARLTDLGGTVWAVQYESLISNVLQADYVEADTVFASGFADNAACLAKIDINTGLLISSKRYDGSSTEALLYCRPTQDGNLLLSDHTLSATGGAGMRVWAMKTDKNGQPIWSKTYGVPGMNLRGRVEPTTDGGYLVAPHENLNAPTGDAFLIKLDASGTVQWAKNYGGAAADRFFKAQETADGGFVAVGSTRSTGSGFEEIFIVKTDSLGRVEFCCNAPASIETLDFQANLDTLDAIVGPYFSTDPRASLAKNLLLPGQDFCVNPQPLVDLSVPLCPGEVATWNGQQYTAPATIFDTLPAPNGCDTLIQIELTLLPQPTLLQTLTFCPGDSIELNGVFYTQPTSVDSIIPSTTGGCDTLATYTLAFAPQPTVNQTIAFCPGDTLSFNGQLFTQPATLTDTIPSATGGCDTVAIYNLVFAPQPTVNQTIAFCPGSLVVIDGTAYTQPGTVTLSVPSTTGGCDTLLVYTLVHLPQGTSTDTIQFCPGESVVINGTTYTQPGTVTVNFPVPGGCDSIATYILQLLPQPVLNQTITFCPGESVTLGGTTYSQSDTVTLALPAANGCDTLATYFLELLPQPVSSDTIQFCPGMSITIDGTTYTQSATVISIVPGTGGGCDTIATYVLQLVPFPTVLRTIAFCPGDTVKIGNTLYTQPDTVMRTLPANIGCDTLATYILEWLPQPVLNQTIAFCPGESVTLGGIVYTQPDTVTLTLPAATGCDTVATYILEWLPLPTTFQTITFCPGDSVALGGNFYTQPDTVTLILSATPGCDTVATYYLELLPQPVLNQTIEFCRGDTVALHGTLYTQPTTVVLNLPATTGCDTVATYTLQYLVPAQPTSLAINCPANVTVQAATPTATGAVASFGQPTVTSDCPCPGIQIGQTSGLGSGSTFPIGTTAVCFSALDSCGKTANCCFNVQVLPAEDPCDVKTNSCIKWELLSITANPAGEKTYRIRLTNNCTSRLTFAYFQVPTGVQAVGPANNSTFEAASGREYEVRNPNYSPYYSVRFKPFGAGMVSGESDIFSYVLPNQAGPNYINVGARLENKAYIEAHLNTFDCPIGVTPGTGPKPSDQDPPNPPGTTSKLTAFPNPTSGELFVDFSNWAAQTARFRVVNAQGRLVAEHRADIAPHIQPIALPENLPDGIYFLEVLPDGGERKVARFVVRN